MDELEITLPVSNKKVVLRNYTTRKDDERAEAVLYAGVAAEQGEKGGQKISFPIANVMASQRAYIPRLVQSVEGNTPIDDLRSEDFAYLEEQVGKIVDEHSPKAKAAKAASKTSITEK